MQCAAIEHPALLDIARLNIDASVVNRDMKSGISEWTGYPILHKVQKPRKYRETADVLDFDCTGSS